MEHLGKEYYSVEELLPSETSVVEVVINNDFTFIGKAMFYNETYVYEGKNIFPYKKGFFGTFYKMLREGITHWKHVD